MLGTGKTICSMVRSSRTIWTQSRMQHKCKLLPPPLVHPEFTSYITTLHSSAQHRHCRRLSPAHKLKGLCFQQSLFDANQQLEVIVLTAIAIPRPLHALAEKCANMPEVYAILTNKTTLKCTRKNTITCFKTTGKQKCVATELRHTSCDMPSDST